MAEINRYKVLYASALAGGGVDILISNTTANLEVVVTDIWIVGSTSFLRVNTQRIRLVSPGFQGFRWPGMFLALRQGDVLDLESTGAINVIIYGFERSGAPTPATLDDSYNYKTAIGYIAWTSGSFPPGLLTTVYTAPADTIFVIHSGLVAPDGLQGWEFLVFHDSLQIHHAGTPANRINSAYPWTIGRQTLADKIIIEPGQSLKIQDTGVGQGFPTQFLLWSFGGVERYKQP